MSEDMVERVARAIGREVYEYDVNPAETPRVWKNCLRMARAAIEAMRAPTQHMLVLGSCYEDPEERYAGDIKLGIKAEGAIAGEVWQAMLDGALSPPLPVGENND